MDHVGLFLARLILTPMLLCICNKYISAGHGPKKIYYKLFMIVNNFLIEEIFDLYIIAEEISWLPDLPQ